MKNYALALVLLLPILGMSELCNFPAADMSSNACITNDAGGCQMCIGGTEMTGALCYPPCPSGFTQLIPGYCLNTTVINKHQNFTLCPTNILMEAYPAAGYTMCESPNPTCQCMPNCPPGYIAFGDSADCLCQYEANQLYGVDNSKPCLSFYVLIALLSMTAFVGFSYLGYRVYNSRAKPINRAIEVPYVNMNNEILAH